MSKFVKTTDGKLWILYEDKEQEESMLLMPLVCQQRGCTPTKYKYTEIVVVDTNLEVVKNRTY